MKQILNKALVVILALVASISLNINLNIDLEFSDSFYGNSAVLFMEFIIFIFLEKIALKVNDKRMTICAALLACFFSICHVVGTSINIYGSLDGIMLSKDTMLKSSIKLIGDIVIFYTAIKIVYEYINKIKNKDDYKSINFFEGKKAFLVSFAIIFICWIPYYLTYFPGLTTGDSMNQIYQCIGMEKLSGHHPLIHTAVISLFINIGKVFNNYNIGVALYTFFQMSIMISICSYAIYYMNKLKFPRWCIIISLIFYAIYPINPLFSMMMWKDILFAGVMLIFVLNIHDLIRKNIEEIKVGKIVRLIVSMLLVMFFRNNGLYVILAMIPAIIILYKRHSKKAMVAVSVALVVYLITNTIIYTVGNIQKGQVREALSIPMQQFARVMKYNENELTEEDKEKIYKFIPKENFEEEYIPTLSDPVKNYFDSETFSNNKVEFISLWAKLMIKCPRTYIESFLCNCYGYWYPEAQNWVANRDVEPNDIGIHQNSIIEGKLVRKIDSIIERRNIPIISMLFSIGFIFWIMSMSLVYCIYSKKYKNLLMYVPIIALWITTLASPVFCEFRYVYSLVTCLPVLTMTIFENEQKMLKKM